MSSLEWQKVNSHAHKFFYICLCPILFEIFSPFLFWLASIYFSSKHFSNVCSPRPQVAFSYMPTIENSVHGHNCDTRCCWIVGWHHPLFKYGNFVWNCFNFFRLTSSAPLWMYFSSNAFSNVCSLRPHVHTSYLSFLAVQNSSIGDLVTN